MKDCKFYLGEALKLAEEALSKGCVPIGALIIDSNGEVIAQGYNTINLTDDKTAHAEMGCIRQAGKKVIEKYSPESTYLFTSLEPCFGCGFFITRTNIKNIAWALNDPYKGGMAMIANEPKLAADFQQISIIAEPDKEAAEKSKSLLRQYYLSKGQEEIANLFI